jgi:hypothetical protein
MKASCQHCLRQCSYSAATNAHTVFETKNQQTTFSSTDDLAGIDICQVCAKPVALMEWWYQPKATFAPPVQVPTVLG